ncbi:MAG: hypothetical protein EDM75_11995, partial [Chlorobiota bacterium]
MTSKNTTLFIIGRQLSVHFNEMAGIFGDHVNMIFAGTDENDLRNYTVGKKLIVNEAIRDYYIDDSILLMNQKEFDDLRLAIEYLVKDTKRVVAVFMTGDPLSLAVTPVLAQASDKLGIDAGFIGMKTEEENERVTKDNLQYFLKNRYRLYLIEKIENNYSL